jgi:hypothetical protein
VPCAYTDHTVTAATTLAHPHSILNEPRDYSDGVAGQGGRQPTLRWHSRLVRAYVLKVTGSTGPSTDAKFSCVFVPLCVAICICKGLYCDDLLAGAKQFELDVTAAVSRSGVQCTACTDCPLYRTPDSAIRESFQIGFGLATDAFVVSSRGVESAVLGQQFPSGGFIPGAIEASRGNPSITFLNAFHRLCFSEVQIDSCLR